MFIYGHDDECSSSSTRLSPPSSRPKFLLCSRPLLLGQTSGDGAGQGSLAYCSPRGQEESDTTWQLTTTTKTSLQVFYSMQDSHSPKSISSFPLQNVLFQG